MSVHSARLCLGANMGLSRMHCTRCGEETLHKTARCIHCGNTFEVAIPPPLKLGQAWARETIISQAKKRKHRRLSIAP